MREPTAGGLEFYDKQEGENEGGGESAFQIKVSLWESGKEKDSKKLWEHE